jgi:hypothetical protein
MEFCKTVPWYTFIGSPPTWSLQSNWGNLKQNRLTHNPGTPEAWPLKIRPVETGWTFPDPGSASGAGSPKTRSRRISNADLAAHCHDTKRLHTYPSQWYTCTYMMCVKHNMSIDSIGSIHMYLCIPLCISKIESIPTFIQTVRQKMSIFYVCT